MAERLGKSSALPGLVFSGIYFIFVILTINSLDTRSLHFDRYYLPILVPLLILVFFIIQDLIINRVDKHKVLARVFVVAVFSIWLVYPLFSTYKYAHRSRLDGVLTYNRYKTRTMRQSGMVDALMDVAEDQDKVIYSNYPAEVWFYTRRTVSASPRGNSFSENDFQALTNNFQGWPGERQGYLVWFLPNYYQHVLPPTMLEELADLEVIYTGKYGQIFGVRASSP